jgi:hypothetical protein
MFELNEPILEDDYPIYGDFMYVADGKLYRSDWHGITVRQLKGREGFKEIRLCDIYGLRKLMGLGN